MESQQEALNREYKGALILAGIKAANYLTEMLTKSEESEKIISNSPQQDYKADAALKLIEIVQGSFQSQSSEEVKNENC